MESTAEWQHDAVRARDGRPILLTRDQLRERGWTPTMITRLVGDPHRVIPLNTSGTRVIHKFRADVIEAAENTDEFARRVAQAARRSAAGKEASARRAAEVRAAAVARAERLSVTPPATWSRLRDRALRRHGIHHLDSDGPDPDTIDRWCRNYLRHECSNYDALLRSLTAEYGRSCAGPRALTMTP